MSSNKGQITIVAKPTHDCNLDCKYCYLEDTAEKGSMSCELLSKSIEQISTHFSKSNWIWHGGEPLLKGVEFYREVKDIQDYYRKEGKEFENSIQTNGILISDELIRFINSSNDFSLGISIDGPKEIHNRTRVYKNGRGSYDEVMRGLNLTRKNNGRGAGVICVVSSQNIDKYNELYSFFKSEKISVKFNPLIKSGKACINFDSLGITPREYGIFLIKLWEIYDNDVKNDGVVAIDIDPFIEVLGNLAYGQPLGCNYTKSCRDSFISVGPKGDVYPCGRFDGIKEFKMGNMSKDSLTKILNSRISKKLGKRDLETVSECKECKFGQFCNSGCMHNAYCWGNIFGKDPYCSSYKKLFSKLKKVVDANKDTVIPKYEAKTNEI